MDEVSGGTQVEIGVTLVTVGQPGPTGNLAEEIRARISTNDGTAVAGAAGKNHTISGPI